MLNNKSKFIVIGVIFYLLIITLSNLPSQCTTIDIEKRKQFPAMFEKNREGFVVESTIQSNVTWRQVDDPYIISNITYVLNNSVLTIEPGVEVIFEDGGMLILGGYIPSLFMEGFPQIDSKPDGKESIFSNGNADKPIKFMIDENISHNYTGFIGIGVNSNAIFRHSFFIGTRGLGFSGTNDCIVEKCNFYNGTGVIVDDVPIDDPYSNTNNITIHSSNFVNNTYSFVIYNDAGENFQEHIENGTYGNKIYANNIINSPVYLWTNEIISPHSHSTWNDTQGHGNYWSDYNGTDLDNDSIGDTNLPWHGLDWCPLMEPNPAISLCNSSWLNMTPSFDPDDKDGDRLPDIWEEAHGLDPADPWDANGDQDNDGLSNTAEYENGTDPRSRDTDGDHIDDKWEIDHGLDPTNPADARRDADDDGLSNLAEIENNTDPFSNDTDGDGMPDGWEALFGLDPLDPSDAEVDADNDGSSNLEEYLEGTNPVELQAGNGDSGGKNLSVLFYVGAVVVAFLLTIIFVVAIKRGR